MQWLVITIAFTLGISFICSLFEAILLSTTVADIQALKKSRPRLGARLEELWQGLDETISAILTLNTVANTLGSVIIGGLTTRLFGNAVLGVLSAAMTFAILLFCEVLPKNLGVAYRRSLQPLVVNPLWGLRQTLAPVTYFCNLLIRPLVPRRAEEPPSDEEIILLAERGAQEGTLTRSESSIIANALSLDDVRVSEIMTPRIVITALRRQATIGEVFRELPILPFGRMPVYGRNLDDIAGLARRRDLLNAKAHDRDNDLVEKYMQEIHFIPDTVTVANALQVCLRTHQQLLVVVDEFGSTAGVVTIEDAIEHLLGREIFEKDDVAVDMREFARSKQQKMVRGPRVGGTSTPIPPS